MITTLLMFKLCFTAVAGAYRHDKPARLYRALAAATQFDCVGQLQNPGSEYPAATGSCVLIGDRFLLTAAHVVIASDYRLDTIYQGKQRIIVNQPYNNRPADVSKWTVALHGRTYRLNTAHIMPGYLSPATSNRTNDLAVIELAEPVTDVAPAMLNRIFDELHDTLTGVGYGASGPANDASQVESQSEKIAGQNLIDSLSGDLVDGRPSVLMMDFDCPDQSPECNMLGSATPLPLEYGTVGGDSGCGAFRKRDGRWELIGILSGAGQDVNKLIRIGYYGQVSNWVRVSVHVDWIDKQMHVR